MLTASEAALRLAHALHVITEHDPSEIAPLLLDHGVDLRQATVLSRISALLSAHTSPYVGPTQDEAARLVDDHPIWKTKIGLADKKHDYTLGDAVLALPISEGSARATIRQHVANALGKLMWSTHADILEFGMRVVGMFGEERCQQVLCWLLAAGPGPAFVEAPSAPPTSTN